MSKCLVAHSGGPTSVLNAALAGIVKANQDNPIYDKVWGTLNGVEGIFAERFVDLTDLSEEEIRILRQTPASALGTCRYKLKRDNHFDVQEIIRILDEHDIETLFYTGGNDSMDTVAVLSEYCRKHRITNHKFIGCPKSVDNDLIQMDHCPGFGSAAKFIATTALQAWLDLNVYPDSRKEVLIMETMGRDAGWLAASACLSGVVDLLIVPEMPFDRELFLEKAASVMAERSKCFITVSEGARYTDGTYLASRETRSEFFGAAVLGGAGETLKQMILDSGLADRCRVQDLSVAQRCHASEQSLTDAEEAFALSVHAHTLSEKDGFSGKMVTLKKKKGEEYAVEMSFTEADRVSNIVRNIPIEWLLKEYAGITEEALDYMRPLIKGSPELIMKDGIPAYTIPYFMR